VPEFDLAQAGMRVYPRFAAFCRSKREIPAPVVPSGATAGPPGPKSIL
jgi:hypothetical protein